jgi:recombination protein RecA
MFPDKPVVYIDVEQAFNKTYAEQIGIDLDPKRFMLIQEGETEAVTTMVQFFAEQAVSLVILDSVAAMVHKSEMESENSSDSKMGGNSKAMSTHLRKMVSICKATGTIVIYVNQVRDNIGVMFGPTETTGGGRGLKFYSSLRIRTSVKDRIKEGEDGEVNGVIIKAEVKKNKIGGAPYRTAEYPLMFNFGLDGIRDLGNLAMAKGLFGSGSGGRYVWQDTKLHGKGAVYNLLRSDEAIAKAVRDTIWSAA